MFKKLYYCLEEILLEFLKRMILMIKTTSLSRIITSNDNVGFQGDVHGPFYCQKGAFLVALPSWYIDTHL